MYEFLFAVAVLCIAGPLALEIFYIATGRN